MLSHNKLIPGRLGPLIGQQTRTGFRIRCRTCAGHLAGWPSARAYRPHIPAVAGRLSQAHDPSRGSATGVPSGRSLLEAWLVGSRDLSWYPQAGRTGWWEGYLADAPVHSYNLDSKVRAAQIHQHRIGFFQQHMECLAPGFVST